MWKTFTRVSRSAGDAHRAGQRDLREHGSKYAAMLACSACAGDYEDPDRTAKKAGDREDEDAGKSAEEDGDDFADLELELKAEGKDLPGY